MVKITIFSLIAALAITSFSFADNKSDNKDLVARDPDGNEIVTFESDGDHFFDGPEDEEDDDPEERALMEMRRRKNHHKHKSHRKASNISHFTIGADKNAKKDKDVQVTWYASHDLQNPACDGNLKPNNGWHIAAVSANWKAVKCGDFRQICNHKAHNRCVKVRIIDLCAGCDDYAYDLTKSAFKILSPSSSLDEGRMHGMSAYTVHAPNPFDTGLFGALHLSG